jgi:hypothetical protein
MAIAMPADKMVVLRAPNKQVLVLSVAPLACLSRCAILIGERIRNEWIGCEHLAVERFSP